MRFPLAALAVFCLCSLSVFAQEVPPDTLSGPNAVPYETDRSFGRNVLAAPSYAWRGFSNLVKTGVLALEYSGQLERAQRYATGDIPLPRVYVLPTVQLGGRDGFGAGAKVFVREPFGQTSRLSVSGLYASNATYSVGAAVSDQTLFDSGLAFSLSGTYRADGFEDVWQLGNDTDEDDRVLFANDIVRGDLQFGVRPHPRLALTAGGAVYSTNLKELDADDLGPNDFTLAGSGLPGARDFSVASAGGTLRLDLSRAVIVGQTSPRTYLGPELLLGYTYGQSIADQDFAFHRYSAEVRGYLPLPFLLPNRRIALRARIEETEPANTSPADVSEEVPFFRTAHAGRAEHAARLSDRALCRRGRAAADGRVPLPDLRLPGRHGLSRCRSGVYTLQRPLAD